MMILGVFKELVNLIKESSTVTKTALAIFLASLFLVFIGWLTDHAMVCILSFCSAGLSSIFVICGLMK